jgi:hypothetical protein
MGIDPTMSIITLNTSELDVSIRRCGFSKWFGKQLYIFVLVTVSLLYKMSEVG